MKNRTLNPIIIGASQYKQSKNKEHPLDPLRLIIKSAKDAIAETKSEEIKNFVDHVYMININSWSYNDAPGDLSKVIGLAPKKKIYLSDGGNTPQMLINRASQNITKGKASAILIAGGEASYSLYQSKKGEKDLKWPEKKEPDYMEGKLWHGINEFENKYKLIVPSYSYALFETALRHARRRSISEHNEKIGKLFHRFSEIASENPYAWSQKVYSCDEVIKPKPNNRLINHPYTKRMCSNMFVDQSAAILMTNEKIAESIGVHPNLWVYPMGGSDYENIFSVCQRPNLCTSPAARYGCKEALNQAGLSINDITQFDIYSCFHSIIEIIKDEIGLSKNDERDLSITGGLPYFGGPWSNYSLHAIVTAIDLIREEASKKIMIIANGGYNTKQSFGIYGKKPPKIPWDKFEKQKFQKQILKNALKAPIQNAKGEITIDGYTIIYNREGIPEKGIVIGTFNKESQKTLAFLIGDPKKFKKLETSEIVGLKVPITFNQELGYNTILVSTCLNYVNNSKL